jgi:hypothetical protein
VFGSLIIAKLDKCIAGCAAAEGAAAVKVKDCLLQLTCDKDRDSCLTKCSSIGRKCAEYCEKNYNFCQEFCKNDESDKCIANCTKTQHNTIVPVIRFYLNDRPIYGRRLSKDAEIHQITVYGNRVCLEIIL